MMTRVAVPLVTVSLLAAPAAIRAQTTADPTATPRIDQRQANQANRTEQGVASGALTRTEANRLQRQQGRIDQRETAAKADGVVTGQEKRRLTRAQNGESRRIAKQKHDRQKAVN